MQHEVSQLSTKPQVAYQLYSTLPFHLYYIMLLGDNGRKPASVAQLAETQCAPTVTVYRRSRVQFPGWTGRFRVWISGAHTRML